MSNRVVDPTDEAAASASEAKSELRSGQLIKLLTSPMAILASVIMTLAALGAGIGLTLLTQPGLSEGDMQILPVVMLFTPAAGLGFLSLLLLALALLRVGGSRPANPKRRSTSLNKRNRWYMRLARYVENNTLWAIIGSIGFVFAFSVILAYLISNELLNALLLVGGFVIAFAFQLLLTIFLMVVQFVALFWFMARSKTEIIKPGDPKTLTLADYKGQKELVKLVKQWISLLSDREQFTKMGGNFINGLLLFGAPGTGKTMLAKCMAGEAGIAFMSIEGSGFRAMFWGVDVMKMRAFCGRAKRLAREHGACIAYIDEIDAVGASRGGVMGGMGMMGGMGGGMGSLTRLLYEMDGISELTWMEKLQARIYKRLGKKPPERDWHVLYMGSTNRPDVLDPALTRPGRFDRSIIVDFPDKTGRRDIVQYYLGKIACDETVSVEAIVADTHGATPARIMSAITKDAVRIALFAGRQKVSQRDIDVAFQEQYFGIEHPIEEMEEDQRRVLAYHEAGHAIAQYYLMPDQRIVRVSIIRRGSAYGYVLPVEAKEWHIIPLRRYILDIMVSMAGRASEVVFFGERFNSVGGDYANVRQNIWVLYVSGMFGPPIQGQTMVSSALSGGGMPQGEKDRIVERYWRVLEAQVEQLLRDHAAEVHAVVTALLERSDLNAEELTKIIEQARAQAMARGRYVPEGLPQMTIGLLPEHQDILAQITGNVLPPASVAAPARSASDNGRDGASEETDETLSSTQPTQAVRALGPNGDSAAASAEDESAPLRPRLRRSPARKRVKRGENDPNRG